jgi:hypothetical protein
MPKPGSHELASHLHLAIRRAKVDEIDRALRQGAGVNFVTAPDWASYNGAAFHAFVSANFSDYTNVQNEVLRRLEWAKADVNAVNNDGRTAILMAAHLADKAPAMPAVMSALLKRGANVALSASDSMTVLHLLADDRKSRRDVVKACAEVVLEHNYDEFDRLRKPDLDARAAGGVTPMMMAARSGHGDLCALFAHYGANIHLRDKGGLRASDYARVAGHYMLAEQLRLREESTAETKPSFDSSIQPKVEWKKLGDTRISRTTVEDPIDYKVTEIFNFSAQTYTCITQNLYTKIEAVTVQPLANLPQRELVDLAQMALERKGGHVPNKKPGAAAPVIKRPPSG